MVALGGKALDEVRRAHWNQLRDSAGAAVASKFKGARYTLLRNPDDLTDRQTDTLARIRRAGGGVWRALNRPGFSGDSVLPAAAAVGR